MALRNLTLNFIFIVSLWFPLTTFATPKPPVVIFDLDDTLFQTSFRTLAILHEVGRLQKFPALRTLQIAQVDYYCSQTCENVGLDKDDVQHICGSWEEGTLESSEWGRRFWSNAYLHKDYPLSGAVEFVWKVLARTNASLAYVTARKVRMQRGTRSQLAFHWFPAPWRPGNVATMPLVQVILGASIPLASPDLRATTLEGPQFPLSDSRVKLFMRTAGSSLTFKQKTLAKLKKDFRVVAVFEDSGSNLDMIHMYREALPEEVPVVRVNPYGSDLGEVAAGVDEITNFSFNVVNEDGRQVVEDNADQLEDITRRIEELAAAR